MFEAAELGRAIAKEEYKARVPALRIELLEAQRQLTDARFPVVVVFAGCRRCRQGRNRQSAERVDGSALDRHTCISASRPTKRASVPSTGATGVTSRRRGRIGLFLSSWYSRPLLDRVYRRNGTAAFDEQLESHCRFERTLTDDGALILKFWMHLGKDAQKKRLQEASRRIGSRAGA